MNPDEGALPGALPDEGALPDAPDHPPEDAWLDLVHGLCEPAAQVELEDHLERCASCVELHAALEGERELLEGLATAPHAAPEGLEERLVEAFTLAAPRRHAPPSRGPWRWVAAALLTLGAGLGLAYRHDAAERPRRELVSHVRASELKALGLLEEAQ